MMVKTKINGEFDIILPKHRADRPEWYTQEGWEKKRIKHMSQNLTKNDTLFYIGAEEGDIAALCAMWVKEIALFEPNPKVWPNIKAIWKANDIKKPLFCWEGFASDSTAGFKIDPIWLKDIDGLGFPPCANGKIISDHGFMELRNRNAPEITIDDVAENLEAPTAISLDVEGSEWQVLRGAEKVLKEYRPKIWLSLHPEFMYEHYKEYAFDLRSWIKNIGYREVLLDYQHEVHLYYEKA